MGFGPIILGSNPGDGACQMIHAQVADVSTQERVVAVVKCVAAHVLLKTVDVSAVISEGRLTYVPN